MLTVLTLGALALAAASLWGTARVHRRSLEPKPAGDELAAVEELRTQLEAHAEMLDALRAEYAQIDAWRDDLTIAVAEGIKNVERAENRVKATVRRAQEKLRAHGFESESLDAEAEDLRLADARRGDARRLHAVPKSVEPSFQPPLGFPGDWTAENTKHLRRS